MRTGALILFLQKASADLDVIHRNVWKLSGRFVQQEKELFLKEIRLIQKQLAMNFLSIVIEACE